MIDAQTRINPDKLGVCWTSLRARCMLTQRRADMEARTALALCLLKMITENCPEHAWFAVVREVVRIGSAVANLTRNGVEASVMAGLRGARILMAVKLRQRSRNEEKAPLILMTYGVSGCFWVMVYTVRAFWRDITTRSIDMVVTNVFCFWCFLRFSSVYGARTVINRAIHAPFQVRSFCQCVILFSKMPVYHPKFRLPLRLTPTYSTSSSFIFHINQFRNTRSVTQNLYLFLHSIPIQPGQHHKSHIPIQNRKQYTINASVSFTHSQHLFLRNK